MNAPKSKVAQVLEMYLAGKKGCAYKTLGKMRNQHLLTDKERKTLVVAGEMLSGNVRFYEQLGYKIEEVSEQAEAIFRKHYNME